MVLNEGRGIAKNCTASMSIVPESSKAKILPSKEDKPLVWDNGESVRSIGAKKGKALLNILFTQENFSIRQAKIGGGEYAEDEKIFAKISTDNSIKFVWSPAIMGFAEDGLRTGENYFKLNINTIDGESLEQIICVTVINDWKTLSLNIID